MIDYAHSKLFRTGSVDKQWKIEYSGGLITNKELFSQSIEISESLCSETELRFGCCEASSLKFKVGNIVLPLIEKELAVSVIVGHHDEDPLAIGKYKVASDKPTSDRRHREIIAYDAMYDIIYTDMTDWYNTLLPDKDSTVTMKQFREAFILYFGLEDVVPEGGLVNDDMIVERTIDPEQISGKDIITAICEINACFGHIGRDGKFHYIYLPQAIEGLYPSKTLFPDRAPEYMAQSRTGHLYPQSPKGTKIGGGTYITVHYEDFRTKTISKLQIRQEENDIGLIYGNGDNCYIIQDNFLVYGKSSEQLQVIAANIYGKITDIVYRPYDADCRGNPCFEVGDPVRFQTKYELVESYILSRTLKGLQALRDTYTASGTEKYAEKVNSIHKSILQLKGKSNVLERTIEMTRLEIKDLGSGLSTEIKITSEEIRGELRDTKSGLETTISATAAGIRADVSKNYETKIDAGKEYNSIRSSISVESGRIASEIERATKAEQNLSGQIIATSTSLTSKIEQTESSINLSVSQSIQETRTYASTQASNAQNAANAATDNKLKNYSTTTQMNAAINLTAQGITQEVSKTYETKTAAGTQYESLSASITATAEQISQKVSKGSLSSEISQEAGKIKITSDRFSLESTNCSISEDGTIKAVNCELSGTLKTVNIENDGIVIDQHGMILAGSGGIRYLRSFEGSLLPFSLLYASGDNVTLNGFGELKLRSPYGITIGTSDLTPDHISLTAKKIDFYVGSVYNALTINSDGIIPKLSLFTLGTSSQKFSKLYVKEINHDGGNLGFFGTYPMPKQSVSTISGTSSATTSSNATKINEIINALKKYGLL